MSDDKAKDVPNVPEDNNGNETKIEKQPNKGKTDDVNTEKTFESANETNDGETEKVKDKRGKWSKKAKTDTSSEENATMSTEAESEDVASDTNTEEERIALETKIAALEEELLRQRAETENFKRRTKKEYETNLTYANQRLIEQFLPVLDAFDNALRTQDANDEATKQFLKGFEMTDALLKQTLEQAGLTPIPSVGEKFDPYLHQAVMQDTDPEKAEDEILEELQKGYKLKDRVIRASMVKTNKK